MKSLTRVILIDDHALFRNGIANMINGYEGFSVIASLNDGSELDHDTMSKRPDIIIMDLSMPGRDGEETCDWLKDNYPEIKILVLSMFDAESILIRLLQKGVRGFLNKDVQPKELHEALKSVAEVGYYYSHGISGKLASLFYKQHSVSDTIEKALLNDNEITFLKLASSDLTYKEIAQKMNVSPRVIDNFRDSLFSKLDVKSRVGLAIYSFKNGIIPIK